MKNSGENGAREKCRKVIRKRRTTPCFARNSLSFGARRLRSIRRSKRDLANPRRSAQLVVEQAARSTAHLNRQEMRRGGRGVVHVHRRPRARAREILCGHYGRAVIRVADQKRNSVLRRESLGSQQRMKMVSPAGLDRNKLLRLHQIQV